MLPDIQNWCICAKVAFTPPLHSYHLNEAEILWRRECLVIFVLQHLRHIHSHLDESITNGQKIIRLLSHKLYQLSLKCQKSLSFDLKFLLLTQKKIPYPHRGLHVKVNRSFNHQLSNGCL